VLGIPDRWSWPMARLRIRIRSGERGRSSRARPRGWCLERLAITDPGLAGLARHSNQPPPHTIDVQDLNMAKSSIKASKAVRTSQRTPALVIKKVEEDPDKEWEVDAIVSTTDDLQLGRVHAELVVSECNRLERMLGNIC